MTDSPSQETGNGRETAVDWQARGTVARLVLGQMATQALGTAVRLGVFDRIGPGELSGDTLAGSLGTHPQATLRLLRALAGLQLLSETEPGVFRTTTAGDALRTDTPGTMVAMARMFTDPVMLRGWDLLDESVRTGETTFDTVFGTDFFGHLKEQPELSAAFNEAMSQGTRLTASNVPHHYDFGRFHTLVDIGGGDGTLLASVLRAHPELRGVLFDTAEGLAQAPRRLAEQDVTGRVVLETGDFFASAPVGRRPLSAEEHHPRLGRRAVRGRPAAHPGRHPRPRFAADRRAGAARDGAAWTRREASTSAISTCSSMSAAGSGPRTTSPPCARRAASPSGA